MQSDFSRRYTSFRWSLSLQDSPTPSSLCQGIRGGPDDTWGALWCFASANFFFSLLIRKRTFFCSQAREQAIFFPPYNPISLPVLWTNFIFSIVCWTNYFLSLFAEQSFFSNRNNSSPYVLSGRPITGCNVPAFSFNEGDLLLACKVCRVILVCADCTTTSPRGTKSDEASLISIN